MIRTGIGYDSHRFAEGRQLILGGVDIPYEKGLAGHSDGDAVLHAIIDAILGAAAMGDIGRWFPNSDPGLENVSSLELLSTVVETLQAESVSIHHVDVSILAEAPKMAPYIPSMRDIIAKALNVPIGQVSVKAKTNEGMGFIGKREGLAAMAVATLDVGQR